VQIERGKNAHPRLFAPNSRKAQDIFYVPEPLSPRHAPPPPMNRFRPNPQTRKMTQSNHLILGILNSVFDALGMKNNNKYRDIAPTVKFNLFIHLSDAVKRWIFLPLVFYPSLIFHFENQRYTTT